VTYPNEGALINAAHRLPPSPGTKTALTIATGTNAVAIGSGSAPSATAGPGWYTFAIGVAFSVKFGDSGVTNPTNTSDFPAGVYDFYIPKTTTHFALMPAATGSMTHWKSSQNDR
jgi:hypothetical protein